MINFGILFSRVQSAMRGRITKSHQTKYLEIMLKRNEYMKDVVDEFVEIEFKNYDSSQFMRLWKYAQLSGMKQFQQ